MFGSAFQLQRSEFLIFACGEKSIFIIVGRSNMPGRGGVANGTWDGYVPHECRPNTGSLRLNTKLRWKEAHELLHKGIDASRPCGVRLGMSFTNSVLERDPCLGVILVPCGFDGSCITEWKRGSNLYNHPLKSAYEALQDGGKIRAILWYQGESDSADEKRAKMYKMRLIEFFLDIRGDIASPVLPIVQVAFASDAGPNFQGCKRCPTRDRTSKCSIYVLMLWDWR